MVVDLRVVDKLPPSELKPMGFRELSYWHRMFIFGIESEKDRIKRAKQEAENRKKLGLK